MRSVSYTHLDVYKRQDTRPSRAGSQQMGLNDLAREADHKRHDFSLPQTRLTGNYRRDILARWDDEITNE